jgi:Tfp pilus assembly protein PilX
MRRRERGSALIVTVLLLLLLGVIGLSALDTVMRDQQVAGFQNRSTAAFYAAEAGVARAKEMIATSAATFYAAGDITNFPTYSTPGSISDTSAYPLGTPSYYGDPEVADPIERLDTTGAHGVGGTNLQMGRARFRNLQYRLRVEGRTADGARSRLEVVALNPIVTE